MIEGALISFKRTSHQGLFESAFSMVTVRQ